MSSNPSTTGQKGITGQKVIEKIRQLRKANILAHSRAKNWLTALNALFSMDSTVLEKDVGEIDLKDLAVRLGHSGQRYALRYQVTAEQALSQILSHLNDPLNYKFPETVTINRPKKADGAGPTLHKREYVLPINSKVEVLIRSAESEVRITSEEINRVSRWLTAFQTDHESQTNN